MDKLKLNVFDFVINEAKQYGYTISLIKDDRLVYSMKYVPTYKIWRLFEAETDNLMFEEVSTKSEIRVKKLILHYLDNGDVDKVLLGKNKHMEYPKFVPVQQFPFTDDEIKQLSSLLINQAKKQARVGDNNKILKISYKRKKSSSKYLTDWVEFTITPWANIVPTDNLRSANSARIVDFKGIVINVYKEGGYIDKWDWTKGQPPKDETLWKDFKNAPKAMYSAHITVMGHLIPYRCRHAELIDEHPSFVCNTEIQRIDFSEAFQHLFQQTLQNTYAQV